MTDTRSLTISRFHQVEDCEPLSEELKARMRWLICGNAVGDTLAEQAADAEELMRALGVHTDSEDVGCVGTLAKLDGEWT